jgi:hypothetical protein
MKECFGHRGDPADPTLRGSRLINPDNPIGALATLFVSDRNRCSEEDSVRALEHRINHFCSIEPFLKKADPPVDFPEPALAIDIISIFRTISVRSGPRNGPDDLGSLNVK